ncbi:MAG: aminotransferase class V-fold PLP-dependent enzyme [Balneolaceae bacterium]|nr:aminotransferase class V-fold PLP-dependent enzyme [Balneolaceae bacterium]
MECQKNLFHLEEGHHYLNCAFLSPLLKSAEAAGVEGIRAKTCPWEVTPDRFFEDGNLLRARFAELVNAPSADRVALMPAVSYGVATAVKNLPRPGKGRAWGHGGSGKPRIVLNDEQFPSNVYAWQRFAREQGCEIHTVEAPETVDGRGAAWNERLLEAITDDTLAVALAPLHWTDGTLFDLEAVGRRCRETGSYLIVDGTQSVGALPFDVQAVQPDALFCAGYKWLLGPYSMALGYFGERLLDGVPLEEGWLNRRESEDFAGLVDYQPEYQPGARRYDVGQSSNFVLVPMMLRAVEQLLKWGPAEIQRYCRELTAPLAGELPVRGYRLENPDFRAHHLFGIRLPSGLTNEELKTRLGARNIHVSLRGSAVRISPNVYNTEEDIAALMEVLKEVQE